jgi:hypothetical protein
MKLGNFIAMALILVGAKSFAQTYMTGDLYVHAGQTKTVNVPNGYYESLQVQAIGAGSGDAMVEVWANGKPKGSLYVPGRDPNYVVTIRERISSLSFRSVSGGTVHIQAVTGFGSQSGGYSSPMLGQGYNSSTAMDVAQSAISVANELKQQAVLSQIEKYLMPIRKSAAHLYAVASTHSQYSSDVRTALLNLLAKVSNAETYLEENLESDSGFDATTQMITIKEQLKAML